MDLKAKLEFIKSYCVLSKGDLIELENTDFNKRYRCSKITKSCGFTILMHLVLLTHKYPSLCTTIRKYCKKYPEEINKVNAENWSALMIATRNICYKSNIKVVKILLENGADPNISTRNTDTALTLSFVDINNKTCKLVKLLLRSNISQDDMNNGLFHISRDLIYDYVENSPYYLSIKKLLLEYDAHSKIEVQQVHDINILNIKN